MARGKAVKAYLQQVIDDMDAGRSPTRQRAARWVRALAIPAAVGLGLGMASCDGPRTRDVDKDEVADAITDGTVDDICELIGAEAGCDPCAELGWYDDGVCDEFCAHADADCDVPVYGVPFETDCENGVDDDGDTLVDCCDDDCAGEDECSWACPEYGGPFVESDCDDCIDNDCDGDTDMDDADCVEIYGVPFEDDCGNGVDDDGDGLVDCCDDECEGDSECSWACPEYGVPMPETDCDDCIDNDCDGAVDAMDSDCTAVAYGVPWEDNCGDGVDDDGDGLIDCCDEDCTGAAVCIPDCPRYAAPLSETSCDNCIDDDCDGLTDGEDPECTASLYGVPF